MLYDEDDIYVLSIMKDFFFFFFWYNKSNLGMSDDTWNFG